MQFFLARAGVAARFGVAARAHHRHAQRHQSVAQLRRFARREHDADVREHDAQRADELRQFAVADVRERLEFTGAGTQPHRGNGQRRLPTVPQQVIRVRRRANRLVTPVGQSVKRADASPAESGGVGASGVLSRQSKFRFGPAVCMSA